MLRNFPNRSKSPVFNVVTSGADPATDLQVNPKELKARTKQFADAVVAFCTPLLDDLHTREIARQLLGSGTGVNANYGSAQVGRSNDEFVAKLGQVVDDASEARGWLELLRDSNLATRSNGLSGLLKEADELTRIFAKSYRTAKNNNLRRKAEKKANSKRKRTPPTDEPIDR